MSCRRTALALVVAALLSGCRPSAAVSSTVWSTVPPAPTHSLARLPPVGLPATTGEADGAVPPGTTALARDVPAIAKLDPALLRALRRAARASAGDGLVLYVESGWRSRAYQKRLFREAVAKYGSPARAARWVAVPGTSAHERGAAVDIGHAAGASWLSRHGARYGLCQVYRNERWHFELRPSAVRHGCPAMYADPTHDPRFQQ